MLDTLKNSNRVVGIKQSLKALQTEDVVKVYIAKDADERLLRTIKEICNEKSIEIEYIDSMKTLGKACGIEVGSAVVCLLN